MMKVDKKISHKFPMINFLFLPKIIVYHKMKQPKIYGTLSNTQSKSADTNTLFFKVTSNLFYHTINKICYL